jgi:cytochrome c oxidase subunit III
MTELQSPPSRISGNASARVSGVSPKQLAMIVLFGTLSMLFGASVVGYLITRAHNDVWKTATMPGLPLGLLASTALLLGLSVAMHVALRAVRRNRFEALQRSLTLALALAGAFVVGQAQNWRSMYGATLASDARTLYGFTFYMLTGLHAAHVLGGVAPLLVVLGKAKRRDYSSSNYEGVKLCGQYWDYLALIWLILLSVLYFAT